MTDLGKTQKRCPQGHVMEPDWDVCPYCKGEREAPSEALARTVRMDSARADPPAASRPASRKTEIMERPVEIDGMGWLVGARGASRGTMHRLDRQKVSVGADRGCEVTIEESHVSELHASIRYQDGTFYLTDLDSTNGTFLNDDPVQREEISDGDRIRFGGSEWIFKCVVFDEGATESVPE